VDAILDIFASIDDPRDRTAQYDLSAMLFIALAAKLCGSRSRELAGVGIGKASVNAARYESHFQPRRKRTTRSSDCPAFADPDPCTFIIARHNRARP
jgi:hypothetical protein